MREDFNTKQYNPVKATPPVVLFQEISDLADRTIKEVW